MPKHDEKFCRHCEQFFPLFEDYIEWHNTGECKWPQLDVKIELKAAKRFPARVEKFINVQTAREIPAKALEGYRVREVFSDSIGRLIVVYEKNERSF